MRARAVCSFVAVVVLVGVPVLAAPASSPSDDMQRIVVVRAYFAALSRGDAAAAADAFAEDGFMIGAALKGLCSATTPCLDRAQIRKNMDLLVKTPHLCETVTRIQATGSIVTGRLEIRNDDLRSRGIERLLQSFLAQVTNGKMIAYFGRSDLADAETARNAAMVAGRVPKGTPITTIPPCH